MKVNIGGAMIGALLMVAGSNSVCRAQAPPTAQFNMVILGGHETNRLDRGRPVVLVAGALGVPSQVFRDAFRAVRPAPSGSEPDPRQVGSNKEALLSALGPYGITNERLDQVSDYYRYNPSNGGLWRNVVASASAFEYSGGRIEARITNPGAGYTSVPQITIVGRPDLEATATVTFSHDLAKNGSIQTITIRKRATESK